MMEKSLPSRHGDIKSGSWDVLNEVKVVLPYGRLKKTVQMSLKGRLVPTVFGEDIR